MINETKWSIDHAHSEIAFKVRHLMISHTKGFFKVFDASIFTTGKDFTTCGMNVWIDVSSIDTGDTKRDEHLKTTDFFDVAHHKQILFNSSSIEKADMHNHHLLRGELTIKGISKMISFQVEFGGIMIDPWGNEKAGFSITGKINRSDWGLIWNATLETGGLVVSDEVTISCEIELMRVVHNETIQNTEPVVNSLGIM